MQLGLFSFIKTSTSSKKRYWLTPPDLMQELDNEFHFDFDPCPNPRPEGFDGLTAAWQKMNYVNPPFTGGIIKWVRKAIEELQKGNSSVILIPIYQSRAVALAAEAGAEIRYIGAPQFLSIEDGDPNPTKKTDRNPCLLLILKA